MADLEKVEKQMISFGLSQRETKVYTTLLRQKDFTALEVQQLANIPRTKVYEVLRKLIDKGMCYEKRTPHNRRYEAVNPEKVFNKFQKSLEEQITLANEISKTLTSQYKQIEDNKNSLECIEIVVTQAQIVERYNSLIKNTNEEIIAFTKGPYINKWESNREAINVVKRGISVKSIYFAHDIKDINILNYLQNFAVAGEEIRISYNVPLKMIIFDGSKILITLQNEIVSEQNLTAMIIEHKDMVEAFKITFNSVWNSAMTLDEFMLGKGDQ